MVVKIQEQLALGFNDTPAQQDGCSSDGPVAQADTPDVLHVARLPGCVRCCA